MTNILFVPDKCPVMVQMMSCVKMSSLMLLLIVLVMQFLWEINVVTVQMQMLAGTDPLPTFVIRNGAKDLMSNQSTWFKTHLTKKIISTCSGYWKEGTGSSLIILMASSWGQSKRGGSPSTISITITPSDHISTYKISV